MFYISEISWFLRSLLGLWLFIMHVFSFIKRRLLEWFNDFWNDLMTFEMIMQWKYCMIVGQLTTHYRNADIILPTFSLSVLIFLHRGCNIYVLISYRNIILVNISLFPHLSGKSLYRTAITFWGTAHRL